MLPEKNLDDELFAEIAGKARKLINKYYPAWTDYNLHDPGITFIELFAWFKEMQQYHLDQISSQSRKKFLKLLGIVPRAKQAASSFVAVSDLTEDFVLPQGSRLLADHVLFETRQREYLSRGQIAGGFSLSKSGQKVTFGSQLAEGGEMHFYIFGSEPAVGDAFYLAIDRPLQPGETHHLYFNIYGDYRVKRNKPGENFLPLADLEWEYYTAAGWQTLMLVQDETYRFIQEGRISFQVAQEMAFADWPEEGCWLRATLRVCDYEVAPILAGVQLNMIPVLQKNTLSRYRDFPWSEGLPAEGGSRTFVWDSELALWGHCEVYLGEWDAEDRIVWRETRDYRKERENQEAHFQVFGSWSGWVNLRKGPQLPGGGAAGPRERMVRLVCYEEGFSLARWAGEGDGFPGQSFTLEAEDVLEEDLQIMVREEEGFVQWEKVADFDKSTPESRHYRIEAEAGELIFGDCERGLAPEGEILVVGFAGCLGQDGNVKEGRINRFFRQIVPGSVVNPGVAVGGRNAESIDEAFLRLRKELRREERAVTYGDYEALVRDTPGLMIENCKAIPVTKNPRRDGSMDENAVSVVVQPFAIGEKRQLNAAYQENIYRQLEHRHLIGTKVSVLSPEYVGIQIFAEILVKPYYRDARERIELAVADFFSGAAWDFGQTVQYSAIYGIIDTLDCVVGIQSLTIDAHGKGIRRGVNGDVNLPQNGMAYLQEAEYMITAGE